MDAGERGLKALGRGWFGDERESAARESVTAVVVEGKHLHRDVASAGVGLEVVEDGPAEHVGQEDVEGDGGGIELAREGEGFGSGHRAEDLEAFVMREVGDDAGVVGIVFDDEQDVVAKLEVLAVVLDSGILLGDNGGQIHRRRKG